MYYLELGVEIRTNYFEVGFPSMFQNMVLGSLEYLYYLICYVEISLHLTKTTSLF